VRARMWGWTARLMVAALGTTAVAPADAFMFWSKQAKQAGPATGGEPGITLPLPGATPKEQLASLVWTLRAGLNVAALQCQFAPTLRTVALYNNMLKQHAVELQATYATLGAYFKRTQPKVAATALDQFTTRTYNSFSTLKAQLGFCETAASIGQETLERRSGQLNEVATTRMREFRASLTPYYDQMMAANTNAVPVEVASDLNQCVDKRGRAKACPK
jgi:hypothetical protein